MCIHRKSTIPGFDTPLPSEMQSESYSCILLSVWTGIITDLLCRLLQGGKPGFTFSNLVQGTCLKQDYLQMWRVDLEPCSLVAMEKKIKKLCVLNFVIQQSEN